MEEIDADAQVTNERIGVLEATQLATDTKLGTMEASIARIDNSLAALLRRFNDLMTREHDQHQGHNNNNNNYDEQVYDNWDEYFADSELDDHDAHRPIGTQPSWVTITTTKHDLHLDYLTVTKGHKLTGVTPVTRTDQSS
jgi:hypothetical protein